MPPHEGKGIRLAVFQNEGDVGTPEAVQKNLHTLERAVARAAETFEAHLISFPELFLSGYNLFPEDADDLAMEIGGPELARVAAAAKKHGIAVLCPYPERAVVGGETCYYDAMALFDNGGILLKNYRKTHLWGPDERKIWHPGHALPEEGEAYTVHPVNGIPVGLLNCYEGEFSELARIFALKGAKLLVIPTAADLWTEFKTGTRTKKPYPDISRTLLPAHAFENDIFIAYSNHCGKEWHKGRLVAEYLGNSIVIDPHGQVMVAARNEPTFLVADCVPADYGDTHPLKTRYFQDRRPELYGELVGAK